MKTPWCLNENIKAFFYFPFTYLCTNKETPRESLRKALITNN